MGCHMLVQKCQINAARALQSVKDSYCTSFALGSVCMTSKQIIYIAICQLSIFSLENNIDISGVTYQLNITPLFECRRSC